MKLVRAALLTLLVGCGGDPAPAEAPDERLPERSVGKPTAEELCRARCERAAACQAPADGCMRECRGWQRDTSHLRGDLLWRMMTCLDSIECPFVEQGSAWQQCFEATRRELPLTDALRRFCFESARRAAACGRRREADQTGCRDQFRHLEDDALQEGIGCLQKPCAEVPVCFQRAFRMGAR